MLRKTFIGKAVAQIAGLGAAALALVTLLAGMIWVSVTSAQAQPATSMPTISCAGGTAKGTTCVCPSGQEPVQVGEKAWRCLPKKGPQLTGPPTISCAGGTAKGTTCVCPGGQEPTQVGENAWRCLPKKGPQLTGPPTISCAGGTAKGTTCVCPSGQEPVQVGENAWRCREKKGAHLTAPPIRCEGGRVVRGRCVCPAGKHAEHGVCKPDRPSDLTGDNRKRLRFNSEQPTQAQTRRPVMRTPAIRGVRTR